MVSPWLFLFLFKDIPSADLFNTEGLSMTSLYHMLSCETAKKWLLHFAEKTCSDKTEQFTSCIFRLSFARHFLTSFPDENERIF